MSIEEEQDAAQVIQLANEIWNQGTRGYANCWEASLNAAAMIYAARIHADELNIFDEAVRLRLEDIHSLLSDALKGISG